MIENPYPRRWKDLQRGVAQILRELGLTVEIEKTVATPRGSVELDVFAIDEASLDKIKYVVECKNWSRNVSQSTVHAFTTVMHEVGANIGFIVSKKGLQSGAGKYTNYTNISGMTYGEFQQRYLGAWLSRYFMPTIGNAGYPLSQYVEPMNSRRISVEAFPTPQALRNLRKLQRHYVGLELVTTMFRTSRSMQALMGGSTDIPTDFNAMMVWLNRALQGVVVLKATCFRELMQELLGLIQTATADFNSIFPLSTHNTGEPI
jgi:hypothetical protein